MQNNPAMRTLLITCAVILLATAGIYSYVRRAPATSSSTATTTSQTLSDGTVVSGLPEGAVITEIPTEQPASAAVAPDYRKPIVYDGSVSAEVRAAIESQFDKDKKLLAINPNDFNAWLNIAILHKIAGDYRGAEAIWLYAVKQWPTSYVAFHNLGDLYQNFLKDSTKAKYYSDQAVKLGAGQ